MWCAPALMRLSHCECHFARTFCHIPCLTKSKDVSGGVASEAAANPTAGAIAAAEEQPPPVQKIEVAVARRDGGEKPQDGVTAVVATSAAPRKSCLKKTSCGDINFAVKGNVQWLDLVGKDLTEVKEFEPSECEDSLDEEDGGLDEEDGELDEEDGGLGKEDGNAACVCVIQ